MFPKVLPYQWGTYCRTNGRRTAVQMGGVLQGFPFLEARKVRRYKWGAYCRTNWRCTAVLFRQIVGVGVSETLPTCDRSLITTRTRPWNVAPCACTHLPWWQPKLAPTAVSRTVTLLLRETRFPYLVDVSDFFFFFPLGDGEGGVRGERRGGGLVFYWKSQEGGGFQEGEGPRGCLRRIGEFLGGGGLNIFFRGQKVHQA